MRYREAGLTLSALVLAVACKDDGGGGGGGGSTTGTGDSSSAATEITTGIDSSTGDSWPANCANIEPGEDDTCYSEFFFVTSSDLFAVGDYDGDGNQDVATIRKGEESIDPDGVLFYAGAGDGTFADWAEFTSGESFEYMGSPVSFGILYTMSAAGDGPDRLWAPGTYAELGTVHLDFWWSQGTVEIGRYVELDAPRGGPWFGDFDGDGATDVAMTTTDDNIDQVVMALCAASACAAETTSATTSPPPELGYTIAADINADGRSDLVTVTLENVDGVITATAWSLAAGAGAAFDTAAVSSPLGENVSSYRLAITDMTGDGNLDLVAMYNAPPAGPDDPFIKNKVHIFPGDGAGGFGADELVSLPGNASSFAAGDLDGDGFGDLVVRVVEEPIVTVVRGLGGGEFVAGERLAITHESTGLGGAQEYEYQTVLRDVTNDGALDIVTAVHVANLQEWGIAVLTAVP